MCIIFFTFIHYKSLKEFLKTLKYLVWFKDSWEIVHFFTYDKEHFPTMHLENRDLS